MALQILGDVSKVCPSPRLERSLAANACCCLQARRYATEMVELCEKERCPELAAYRAFLHQLLE